MTNLNKLQEMIYQANEESNGAYEHIIKTDFNTFWCDLEMQELTPSETANMVHFGTYNPTHDYIGLNGYGNIETMTEEEYHSELLSFEDEIKENLEVE